MASYNNPQPFVPQIPEFQPDLNSYQQLLSMKESQYQAGYQKVSGIYGSLYNSTMIREDNKQARQKYFDKIESDIKRLSGFDLSLEQNVTSAQNIFKPLSDDPFIAKDIAFTKQVQSELGRAESLRNTVPKEGEPKFWEGGIKALTYQVEDFAAAPREKSLSMSAPRYTPFVNVAEKAMKWAKDMGLSMKTISREGGFIITTKNGTEMTADLRDTFLSVFGNDASVQEMYRTQAYLTRKDSIAAMMDQYDSPEMAESAYLDMSLAAMEMDAKEVLAGTVPKLETIAAKKSLAEKAMQSYNYDPELDNDIRLLAEALNMDQQAVASTKANAESILQHVNISGMGQLDLDAKRLRVDGAAANHLMLADMTNAAMAYSQLTMEQDVQVDPYALAATNHANTMSEIQARAETDLFLEYAKYGIDAHAPDAFDQMKAMRIAISQGGGKGTTTAPGYPGTQPAPGFGGGSTVTGGNGGLHPSMTVDPGGVGNSTDAEKYKVYEENYKKVETTQASAISTANDFTNSWMADLVSVWENGSTPEQKSMAMGEIRKIVGEDQFQKMSRQLGGDANVVGELKKLRMEKGIESFFYDAEEGSLSAIYGRAMKSLEQSSKAYSQADASARSSGKILEVPTDKLAQYQQKSQQTKRAYNDWKAFDTFSKNQNQTVGTFIQGKVAGIPSDQVKMFVQDGKIIPWKDFVAKNINAALTPKEEFVQNINRHVDDFERNTLPLARSNKDRFADIAIATADNMIREIAPRESELNDMSNYPAGVSAWQWQQYKEHVEAYRHSGAHADPPRMPRARDLHDFRIMSEEKAATEVYNKISSKFYEVYNGNFQSPDGSGAVARQWNGSPLLGNQSGGATAANRTYAVDMANFTDPDFQAVHEVMTNSQGVPGSYQFGSVKTIEPGDLEQDDDAQLLWEKVGSVFKDSGLAKDDELGRARGKLEVSGITAGDPYTVGFTWRADPAFILANRGTKTKPGIFTDKDEERMMKGITFTADKREASGLSLVRQAEISPEDARLGISDQMNPIVLSQADGGKVSVYRGAQGYVVEGFSLDVKNGKVMKVPISSFTRPFTTTNLVQDIERSLMENALRVRQLRMQQKEESNG
jgi:hypothetical protein